MTADSRRRLLRALGLGGHDRLVIALRATVEWQRVRIEHLEALMLAQARPRPWLGDDERPVLLLGTGGGGTRVLGEAALRLGVILGRRVNETFDSIEWAPLVYDLVLAGADRDARACVLAQAQAIHAPLVTEGGRWGIKLPELMLTLPPFLAAFPAAQAVLLLRHPVAASLRRHHITSTPDHPLGRAVPDQGYRTLGLDPARAPTGSTCGTPWPGSIRSRRPDASWPSCRRPRCCSYGWRTSRPRPRPRVQRGGMGSGPRRVQAGARAAESDPARGVVRLRRATDDATRTKGLTARRALPTHLGCDALRGVRVGAVDLHSLRECRCGGLFCCVRTFDAA